MGFVYLQVFGGVVVLALLAGVLYYMRKTRFDWFIGSMVLVLLGALMLILFPGVLSEILSTIGFSRPLDALLTLLAVSGFVLGLRANIHNRKMRREITLLVRERAIEGATRSKGRRRK